VWVYGSILEEVGILLPKGCSLRWDFIVEWDVIFVRSVQDWELDVVLSFFDQLYSCEISHCNINHICWSHSKKGKFEVKSFYKALSNLDHDVFPWKSIWLTKMPTRIAFFG
jgi:hypothetical protein